MPLHRVNIVAEGPTEQGFVVDVLQPEFDPSRLLLAPRLIGTPGHKGGYVSLARVVADVAMFLTSDPAARCTTFIDYYGLGRGWPDRTLFPPNATTEQRATWIEAALRDAVSARLATVVPADRFMPYVQMHEFEGLLFSDPQRLATCIAVPGAAATFQAALSERGVKTPEDVNDGPQTAPSKRIIAAYPRYERTKPLAGPIAALDVGVAAMRSRCPRFAGWVNWLSAPL